jgi:hypothetical protein
MAQQGSYPLNGRTLAGGDTLTGVVTGQTADVPLSVLAAFFGSISAGPALSGPTVARPVPLAIGQPYFDTTLGFMVWCSQLLPALWVDAAGVVV